MFVQNLDEIEELRGSRDPAIFADVIINMEKIEDIQDYQGEANNLFNHLKSITTKAARLKGRTCAVITTTKNAKAGANANATLVIMIDDKNLCLFDSHGSEGVGASLKFFKDANHLTLYIQKEFFTNKNDDSFQDGSFSIKVLNKQLP